MNFFFCSCFKYSDALTALDERFLGLDKGGGDVECEGLRESVLVGRDEYPDRVGDVGDAIAIMSWSIV